MLAANRPWRALPGKPNDVTLLDLTSTIACGVLHRKTGVGVQRVRSPDADRVEDRMFAPAECVSKSALLLGFGVGVNTQPEGSQTIDTVELDQRSIGRLGLFKIGVRICYLV